ncbi:MAG: circularly permuted type 2 ATP-grasp protein [Verrucomicrobiota bacterium]
MEVAGLLNHGSQWHELYDASGQTRPHYEKLLHHLGSLRGPKIKTLGERMEATLREMGVSFTFSHTGNHRPWICDLLPHVFTQSEWDVIVRGFRQRLKAFEFFLEDIYTQKQILREGVLPIHPVLGSRHYQAASIGLPRPLGAYLHLSGICLTRDHNGTPAVKHHHFAHASGISYMMQNRRALVRAIPEIFQDTAVQSLAETPLAILERLRALGQCAPEDLSVVLLSTGTGSPVYSEHSFLARRMGIPVVQGGDLLVLDDKLYLKTVRGLEQVEVVYNRVADRWLDPLVFDRNSRLGIPGLVQCLRKGTVALINSVGSEVADDRSLLPFASKIIRYYLNESPILPSVRTHWLGDLDQREMVLDDLDSYHIRPLFGDGLSGTGANLLQGKDLAVEIRRRGPQFIAQPRAKNATAVSFENGKMAEREQEHVVFAMRTGPDFEVFPGALTRVELKNSGGFESGWTSRDTWVPGDAEVPPLSAPNASYILPARQITSRVADAFYWMGRYLERAYHQAYLIQAVETLETEELNQAERKLYRPMWNRLLPPLEKSAGESRRSITNRLDRYKLVLSPEPGSLISTLRIASKNALSVQECLSPEAWAVLSNLLSRLQRQRYRKVISDEECARVARRLSEVITQFVPQFFATSTESMLADDGWRFCEAGQMLERAIITSNAVLSISDSLKWNPLATEIELSAFLRLLGTRDAYRRVYQMRAEPIPVLEILFQNEQAPRSVTRCLMECAERLRASAPGDTPGPQEAIDATDLLLHKIRRIDWAAFIRPSADEDAPASKIAPPDAQSHALPPLLADILKSTLTIHELISDGFFSHQAQIAQRIQPLLRGF